VNSLNDFGRDDSTKNIVMAIIIIINTYINQTNISWTADIAAFKQNLKTFQSLNFVIFQDKLLVFLYFILQTLSSAHSAKYMTRQEFIKSATANTRLLQ